MADILDTDAVINALAELKTLRDQVNAFKAERRVLLQTIEQQRGLLEDHTAHWNIITVQGQVSEVGTNSFLLTQGDIGYDVQADGHPCSDGDWVMVSGVFAFETHYDDPPSLIIQAKHIAGIINTSAPTQNGAGDEPLAVLK